MGSVTEEYVFCVEMEVKLGRWGGFSCNEWGSWWFQRLDVRVGMIRMGMLVWEVFED
ncbi:hypothetical protein [Candidatus Hodgkinia cicadicola]|uniref:hypothetical protein n=1 Tax=Candidatus Hodgkinia cicadicola TaxID=573658 RepID=UPI001788C31A